MVNAINPALLGSATPLIQPQPGTVEVGAELGAPEVRAGLLDIRNQQYDARYEAWVNLSLLYEGGDALKARAERVLKKRPREDEEIFACRLDQFTYHNILKPAIGFYGAGLFEKPVELFFTGEKELPDFYKQFLENCDTRGTSYPGFWSARLQEMLLYGFTWTMVDTPPLPPGVTLKTRADDKAYGQMSPHLFGYSPLSVINWQMDDNGQLEFVVLKIRQERQQVLQPKRSVDAWYVYDRHNFYVYEYTVPQGQETVTRYSGTEDGGRIAKLVRQGRHPLAHIGRVPFRYHAFDDCNWLANNVYLQVLDHLNQDNTLKWALFMSNLAVPVVIGDVDMNNQSMNENGFYLFPAGTEYKWTEPEGKSFIHSAKRIENLREEIYRTLHLHAQGRGMKATPAMQSGRSKQLDYLPAKQIMTKLGADLRRCMQLTLQDVIDVRSESYRSDIRGFVFEDGMTTEEVFAASSTLSMKIPSRKFEKGMQKKIVRAWMPDASKEELEEMYIEVETGPTMEEIAKQELKDKVQAQGIAGSLKQGSALPKPPGRGGDGPSLKKEGE